MINTKINLEAKWIGAVLMAFLLVIGLGQMAVFAESFGDIPLDPATYQKHLKTFTDMQRDALPASYDARNDGIVTPAKDQGGCGSCWAFATVGAMESHLMKKWGYGLSDLSEQQQLSCNTEMWGCSGGNSSAPKWWDVPHGNGPIAESCFPYTASDTTPCSYSCTDMVTRVVNWHTVAAADFKTSCYNEGPSYWRYDVYTDFADNGRGFWYEAGPGDVYVNRGGSRRAGHAVLLIGWDDAKGAYLCKNSWGATSGPNGDGTFWIAYSGHVNNLGFGMSNFDLINNPQPPQTNTICIDVAGLCNDFKLMYPDIEGEIVEIHGYEYGCGYDNRSVVGTAKLGGGTINIGITGTANGNMLAQWDFVLGGGSITCDYSYHYDGYHNGSCTGSIVNCPVSDSEIVVDGADAYQPQ
jgi:hypothetical protein